MADEYTITKQIRVSVMSLEGIPSMGYRVYFQVTETQHVDFVEVTETDYNAEMVAELIAAKVEKHLEIAQL